MNSFEELGSNILGGGGAEIEKCTPPPFRWVIGKFIFLWGGGGLGGMRSQNTPLLSWYSGAVRFDDQFRG